MSEQHTQDPTTSTKSGLTIPSLGFGTWELDSDTAAKSVRHAIDTGWRHIDTAQMYGNEAGVGSGIAASGVDRDELFVTTKISNENHEPETLVSSMKESLDTLAMDHVDLTLIHWPVEWDRIDATMEALAQVQEEGLSHYIGVSNFTFDQLDHVVDLAPVNVLQVECHPFFQQSELRRWCVDHDWIFTAYSPLGRGEVIGNEALEDIGKAHDATAIQVALAYLIGLENVVTIPRSSDKDHIDANRKAIEIELSDEERARIEDLDAGQRMVDPPFAPWND